MAEEEGFPGLRGLGAGDSPTKASRRATGQLNPALRASYSLDGVMAGTRGQGLLYGKRSPIAPVKTAKRVHPQMLGSRSLSGLLGGSGKPPNYGPRRTKAAQNAAAIIVKHAPMGVITPPKPAAAAQRGPTSKDTPVPALYGQRNGYMSGKQRYGADRPKMSTHISRHKRERRRELRRRVANVKRSYFAEQKLRADVEAELQELNKLSASLRKQARAKRKA